MIAPARRARRPLTPEQRDLAARYLALARGLARPYKLAWPDSRDEFESAACFALVQAAESYEPAVGVKFTTFAHIRIRWALRDVLRRRGPSGWRRAPEDAPAVLPLHPLSEGQGRVLLCEPDPPVGSDLEAEEAVERRLRILPPEYAAVMRRIYLRRENFREAALALGRSQTRVVVMHGTALAMLRGTRGF